MARTDTFQVGQKVRRLREAGNTTTPNGFEGVIRWIEDEGSPWHEKLWFSNTEWGYNDDPGKWELVQPVVPVVERTVREIVPGTYDGVTIWVQPTGGVQVYVTPMVTSDPGRLTRAAAVLTAIAEALRDAQ